MPWGERENIQGGLKGRESAVGGRLRPVGAGTSPAPIHPTTYSLIIRRRSILDHKPRRQPRYLRRQTRLLHRVEHSVEVLIRRRGLVARISPAVGQDVALCEGAV